MEHPIADEVLTIAAFEISKGNEWMVYNPSLYFIDKSDVYFFSNQEEEVQFANDNRSDYDNYKVLQVRSIKEILEKIPYGHELENQNLVFKIQMVGDGYIKGRQAPSYSDKDFDQIVKIKEILQSEYKKMDHRLRDIELSEEEVNQRIENL